MSNKNKNTLKVGGETFKVGNKLGAGEIRKIAQDTGKSVAQVANKASNQSVKVSSAARNVVQRAAAPAPAPAPAPTYTPTNTSTDTSNYISGPTYDYATTLAEIAGQQATTSINANSLIEVERIRQAGESERTKMDIESRIPTIQAEAKGRIDLQDIVNAGYKNIANIERGSNMFSSIMGAFNF